MTCRIAGINSDSASPRQNPSLEGTLDSASSTIFHALKTPWIPLINHTPNLEGNLNPTTSNKTHTVKFKPRLGFVGRTHAVGAPKKKTHKNNTPNSSQGPRADYIQQTLHPPLPTIADRLSPILSLSRHPRSRPACSSTARLQQPLVRRLT